jgi:PAS domain S-box-containing protein
MSQDGTALPQFDGNSEPLILARDFALDVAREGDVQHKLLQALPVAVYTTDAAGYITFYNEAAAALWGRRPKLNSDQWCGSWRMYWPDGTPLPHDECPMAVALKERRNVTGNGQEAVAEQPDGTRIPFMAFPSLLRDAAGEVVGALNMFVDISERKRSEEIAQRLASIVESSDDAIIGKNLDGIITSWNKSAERLFGYGAEEVVGKSITILIPADRQGEEDAILKRIRSGQRVEHFETVRQRKYGGLMDISLTISPIKNSLGKIIGASKIARDITERKRAAEAAQRAEREFRDFVENASIGMHSVDADGIIVWANRTEMEMLGFAREEYVGRHIAEFHVDRPLIEGILQRLANRETLLNYEAQLCCRDGSVRHVLINSNVLWDGDRFVHTRCFTRDISDRKQSEAQIATLAREAEHRAKNVLATVQATVHLTQSDTVDGLKRAISGRIQALANVHRLFVESRWTGAELRNLARQELSPYCQDGDARARIDGADVLLEPNAAQAIAVCLHELATNAAKYGALSLPEGRVHIAWSRATDGRLIIRWTETNGPSVTQPTRRGFGTRVMERMVQSPLKGEIRFEWLPEGLACVITAAGALVP